MHKRVVATTILLSIVTTGCITSGTSPHEDGGVAISLGPLIGLIGMAVDGDDKDDYERFFHDGCDCDCCD